MATILIVEDRPTDRKLLKTLLSYHGDAVLEAADGLDALAMVERHEPDLVISDVLMPTMDGYEFVRRMRSIPTVAQTPVIFYTATYHEREARALAAKCGVVDVLTKPSERATILARVEAVLARPRSAPAAIPDSMHFDREHLRVLGSELLDKVQTLDESEHRLAALVEMGQRFSTHLDSEALLQQVCASAREVTLAQYVVLGLFTDDGTVDLVRTCGLEESPNRGSAATFSSAEALERIRTGRQSIVRLNPTGRPEALGLPANYPAVFSYLEVPLASPGRVHGWVGLANKLGAAAFTADDAMVASALGVQAGIAFENARLVEELKRQAAALQNEVENRARVEEQLRANDERLRQLADAMPQIVWSADANGVIDYCNRRWYELTGFNEAERRTVVEWISILHPDDREVYRQAWTRALDDAEPCQVEFRLHDHVAGKYRWFLGRAVPVADANGVLLRWFGTCTDIDDQKQTEQRLRETSRARDEFLAVVSHELRTPLNAMLGWSKILTSLQSNGPKNRSIKDRAHETIKRNGQVLERLINDLLDLAGVTAGNARLDHEPVNLATVVEAAIDSLQLAIRGKNIRLTRDLDRTVGPVQGDFNRLRQVVWNLLSNAIKFTSSDGQVTIRLEAAGLNARISVTDTGVGIPTSFLPFVFERFRQADSTSTRSYGGLGLGLAIARHFVELHGGTIQVDSAGEGCGAQFNVNLPILFGQVEPRRATGPVAARPIQVGIVAASGRPLNGARILVVEDDRDTRDLLLLVLENAGASVTAVGSAADAFERLSMQEFTALLSDVAMPDEDGCALITRVRGLPARDAAALPAIALTGYARVEDRDRMLAAGFQECLTKPIDPPELVASMVALIH